MSEEQGEQLDAFTTPGTLLRDAREALDLSQREVADRLHLMPGYPAIIERDEYDTLRHPAFARGYVKAYGKLVGVDEETLLDAFDRLSARADNPQPRKIRTRQMQLQQTGLAVVIGLVLLLLFVFAIWWLRADSATTPEVAMGAVPGIAAAFTTPGKMMAGEV